MRLLFSVLLFCGFPFFVSAHQTPTTIVLLDVSPNRVAMELQLPLSELELSFGHDVSKNPETLVQNLGAQLQEYLQAHIHPYTTKEKPWQVQVTDMKVEKAQQVLSGPPFQEITVHLNLIPPVGVETRKFTLDYDVIMHQVINHAAFVSIRNDWEIGRVAEPPTEVGVIQWNTKDNVIYPFEINLEKGSWWSGFQNMVGLGMQHIKEGTDHLLFLIVLLLPAMLLLNGNDWGGFGGTRYSIMKLLKIVTAFTVGHSFTLLIGALGWVKLPTQPVEILIAISILVSAVHAIYPLFFGREMYVAAGFGLIHGLAFATVLSNLKLSAGPMALSILGFNLGIEMMQLFVIACTVPWLILLSQTLFYKLIRIIGAMLAGIAALAWISERVTFQSNPITNFMLKVSSHASWLLLPLAAFAIILFFASNRKKPRLTDFL